jgi:Mrp family chromosome partitioning ATPase
VLITCWSPKGGSGTSVVAAALALLLSRLGDTTLVDLTGDQPAVLGLPDPPSPGVAGWLSSADDVGPSALVRLAAPVAPGLELLAAGAPPLAGRRAAVLAEALAALPHSVVVDAGDGAGEIAAAIAEQAAGSLLVLRPCYLALRRALGCGRRPSGVVLVAEPWRSLQAKDVENVIGVPVVAEVPIDPAVARAVDAGLLAARLPRVLERELRRAA